MILSRFATSANHGRLPLPVYVTTTSNAHPAGPITRNPAIRSAFWESVVTDPEALPPGLPRVTECSPDLRRPWDRLMERMGSDTNPSHFVFLRDSVNAIKGQIECFRRPMEQGRLRSFVRTALAGDETAIHSFITPLREVSRDYLGGSFQSEL